MMKDAQIIYNKKIKKRTVKLNVLKMKRIKINLVQN